MIDIPGKTALCEELIRTMLYTGGRIGNLELKNRWVMLAMHTGYAEPDGRFGFKRGS